MEKNKIFNIIACVGEVLVIVGAMVWITGSGVANYLYAAGAAIFAIGRLSEKSEKGSIVLARLYGQRTLGVIVLLLSAVVMNLRPGFYLGMYLRSTAWLIPFVVFVVIELYTAFRIPAQIKKENYGQKLFQLINETYCVLYGYSLLSEKQIDQYVDLYLSLADPRMFSFVEGENGELIALAITIPSLSEALQKCRGEIFPFGWWHLLKAMYWKKPDTLDMLLIGVRPDYQSKGVNALLFCDLFKTYKELGFKYAETNANLETNAKVQAMWSPFEKEQHKKRWVFGKEI